MRFANLIVVTTIVLGLAFAAQHFPNANAADDVVADADKVYPVSYRLTDLPVWSQDGKMASATLLMAYLKSNAAWGKSSTMAPYPREKPSALVVSTTRADHKLIADALDRLRDTLVQSDAE